MDYEHLSSWHSFYLLHFCSVTTPLLGSVSGFVGYMQAMTSLQEEFSLGSLLQLAFSSHCVLKLVYIC